MKSIMQEASSVIKAIEKGWEAAGKPKQFTITVFEEPKKNFIGMTVQSAKVGIFFDEHKAQEREISKPVSAPIKKKETPIKPFVKKEPFIAKTETEKFEPEVAPRTRPMHKQPIERQQYQHSAEPLHQKDQKIVWTPEMVSFAEQWLTQTLATLNLNHVSFKAQPSHYQLMITFDRPLLEQPAKEQQLMKSFSLLLIQTLRNSFKRPLRGFKIMMTRAQ